MRFASCNQRLTAITDDSVFEAVWAFGWDGCRVAAVWAASPALGGFEVWRYRDAVIEDKALSFKDAAIGELLKVLQNPAFKLPHIAVATLLHRENGLLAPNTARAVHQDFCVPIQWVVFYVLRPLGEDFKVGVNRSPEFAYFDFVVITCVDYDDVRVIHNRLMPFLRRQVVVFRCCREDARHVGRYDLRADVDFVARKDIVICGCIFEDDIPAKNDFSDGRLPCIHVVGGHADGAINAFGSHEDESADGDLWAKGCELRYDSIDLLGGEGDKVVESRNRNHNSLLYHSRLPGRQSVIWQIVG